MSKLLILDKNGTLIRPKSGSQFVQQPQDQELLPGVAEAIAQYRADGWVMAITSNQGGVATGHKSLADAITEMSIAMQMAGIEWGMLAHLYEPSYGEAFLLDLSDGGSQVQHITNAQKKFRKPSSGMIDYLAASIAKTRRWHKVFDQVLMVGDRPKDKGAAIAAGVRFMWAHEWRNKAQIAQGFMEAIEPLAARLDELNKTIEGDRNG